MPYSSKKIKLGLVEKFKNQEKSNCNGFIKFKKHCLVREIQPSIIIRYTFILIAYYNPPNSLYLSLDFKVI